MIQDKMIDEIQELKLAGFTLKEAYDELKARHTKVPTLKTVRKYYNMDCAPDDNHARVRKQMAFDCEPFASAIVEIVNLNPGCYAAQARRRLERAYAGGNLRATWTHQYIAWAGEITLPEKAERDTLKFYLQAALDGMERCNELRRACLEIAAKPRFKPYVDALARLNIDETPVQVLKEPKRKPQSKSYMWLFAGAACDEHPVYVFEYHPTRGKSVIESFLDGWTGYIVTDGYAVYDTPPEGVKRVGCIVHARRNFYRIVQAVGAERAEAAGSVALEALGRIQAIVAADNELDGLGPDERKARRLEEVKPLMEEFLAWAVAARDGYAAPGMKLYQALDYAIEQWPAIMRALDDGRLPIDNNRAEQAIRPFAVGRRNWLFSDTQAGAHASAGIYSIVTTARANGLKTFEYLAWALSEMPRAEAAGELDAARFLPWSPDVPESCCAPREEAAEMFADEPFVDVDVDEYEEIVNSL